MTPIASSAPARGLAVVSRLAVLIDATRRGGVRVVRVAELERFEGLAGSYVMETRNPAACHFLPWARLSTRRTIREKLRAAATLSTARPLAAQRPEQMPVMTTAQGAAGGLFKR